MAIIGGIMDEWRAAAPSSAGGTAVARAEDYAEGLYGLPQENVLKFHLEDGSWFCLRPSGTEPKIKMYFAVQGTSAADAEQRLAALRQDVMARIDAFIASKQA